MTSVLIKILVDLFRVLEVSALNTLVDPGRLGGTEKDTAGGSVVGGTGLSTDIGTSLRSTVPSPTLIVLEVIVDEAMLLLPGITSISKLD